MKRYTFWQLFDYPDKNLVIARCRIKIGQITLNPGTPWGRGVVIAGINIFNFIDSTYQCDIRDGTYIIKRIYL